MLKVVPVNIADIYVPTDRRKELVQGEVDAIVAAMMKGDAQKPIRVRQGKGRFVLIAGVNQLEASKQVGEASIDAYIVQARKF